MAEKKGKGGRPSSYSTELATRICSYIADGKSLRTICRADDMPSIEAVRLWLASNQEFLAQYARAREESADVAAEEIIEIADNPDIDPNARRVMIDARKWIASKLKPKRYGDRLDVNSTQSVTMRNVQADMTADEATKAYRDVVRTIQ